jgi:[acyl-carrier-protein] S-malonyltransferase
VISGSKKSLARAMELAQDQGARRVVALQVSGAFHSGLMEPAVEGMTDAIAQVTFNAPSVPVIANITAKPLTTAEEVRAELISQICSCVDWRGSVNYMTDTGIKTFVEIGPGQVLSGLIKRINPEVLTVNIGEPQPGKSVLKWQPVAQLKDVKLKGAKAKKDRAWGWITG